MSLSTYDPKEVKTIVGGAEIEGFADGTFVMAERTSNMFDKVTGADNRTTRVKTNDFSGTITITLQQSSPSNNVLSAIQLLDETANEGIVPIKIKDLLGATDIVTAYGWIRKTPNSEFSKELTNRVWVFDCADLTIIHGGNPTFQG